MRRSLKTQQHAGRIEPDTESVSSSRTRGPSRATCQARSTFLVAGRPEESAAELEKAQTTILLASGAPKGSLERR